MNFFQKMKLIFPFITGISFYNNILGSKSEKKHIFFIEDKEINIYYNDDEIELSNLDIFSFNIFMKENFQKFLNELETPEIDLSIFFGTINLLNKEFKMDKLLKLIEVELCKILKCEGASILIFNKEENILNFFITSGGASGKIDKIPVPLKNSVAGYIFTNDKTFVFNEIEKIPFHFKGTDDESGFKTNNIIGTPIKYYEESIGVLEAVNKEKGFTKEDEKLIEIFSKIISTKLLNSKLYEEIEKITKNLILSCVSAIDYRDRYTHMHSRNVRNYAIDIARYMKKDEEFIEILDMAALIHDIGKIGIPDKILNKTGKLTDEEFDLIKSHTTMGAEILEDVEFIDEKILAGPLEHHEKLDGSGYPNKLTKDEISDVGKILAVADVFDALTTERPYKKAWEVEKVLKILREDQDIKYSKEVIDALEILIEEKK